MKLEDRIVSPDDDLNLVAVPNFEEVDRKVQSMRDESLLWLKTALGL